MGNNVKPNPAITFEAETFRRIQPEEYLRRFIQKHVRPDGRSFNHFRKTTVNLSMFTFYIKILREINKLNACFLF